MNHSLLSLSAFIDDSIIILLWYKIPTCHIISLTCLSWYGWEGGRQGGMIKVLIPLWKTVPAQLYYYVGNIVKFNPKQARINVVLAD